MVSNHQPTECKFDWDEPDDAAADGAPKRARLVGGDIKDLCAMCEIGGMILGL